MRPIRTKVLTPRQANRDLVSKLRFVGCVCRAFPVCRLAVTNEIVYPTTRLDNGSHCLRSRLDQSCSLGTTKTISRPVGSGRFDRRGSHVFNDDTTMSIIYVPAPQFEPPPPPPGGARVVDDTSTVCWLYPLNFMSKDLSAFPSHSLCSVTMEFYLC